MNATMGDLAGVMQTAVLDRPVIDKTGLQGRYDFTLRWTPDETQFVNMGVRVPPPQANDPDAPPGLFTAFQEQLGLKLESTKGPVDVLVVDRIDKPSENKTRCGGSSGASSPESSGGGSSAPSEGTGGR